MSHSEKYTNTERDRLLEFVYLDETVYGSNQPVLLKQWLEVDGEFPKEPQTLRLTTEQASAMIHDITTKYGWIEYE